MNVSRDASGRESIHLHDNKARSEKPFRFSPPGLSVFSELYLREESSAENLGSFLLFSLSFFGMPTIEVNFQPVACDIECELRGTRGTSSGVGGSMGSRDGDGAVDGRLRMGRRSFGGVLAFFLSGCGPELRGVNISFPDVPLIGVEGELKARPADRGRKGVISCRFPSSCIVDGRFLFAKDPNIGRGSVRCVAVDGRSSCLRLFLLLCVVALVVVDDRWLVEVVLESPDVEGRTTPFACEGKIVLVTPELVAALCFLTSLAWAASLLTRFKACCSTSRHLMTS